ncbi:MAG: helix-turn-helix domain-containing protein [Polyangia bacterium]
MKKEREWMRAEEVAEMLGVSRWRVQQWLNSGEMPCLRLSQRNVRITKSDVETFLESRRVGPRPVERCTDTATLGSGMSSSHTSTGVVESYASTPSISPSPHEGSKRYAPGLKRIQHTLPRPRKTTKES